MGSGADREAGRAGRPCQESQVQGKILEDGKRDHRVPHRKGPDQKDRIILKAPRRYPPRGFFIKRPETVSLLSLTENLQAQHFGRELVFSADL